MEGMYNKIAALTWRVESIAQQSLPEEGCVRDLEGAPVGVPRPDAPGDYFDATVGGVVGPLALLAVVVAHRIGVLLVKLKWGKIVSNC